MIREWPLSLPRVNVQGWYLERQSQNLKSNWNVFVKHMSTNKFYIETTSEHSQCDDRVTWQLTLFDFQLKLAICPVAMEIHESTWTFMEFHGKKHGVSCKSMSNHQCSCISMKIHYPWKSIKISSKFMDRFVYEKVTLIHSKGTFLCRHVHNKSWSIVP